MGGVQLIIDFLGEPLVVEPTDTLTFGRAAELVIDADNLYLHRVVGRFVNHGSLWWIENHGQQIELDVESDTGVRAHLPARDDDEVPRAPLVGSRSSIRFAAGGSRYEVEVYHGGTPVPDLGSPELAGRKTSQFGQVDLTADERVLLAALAEPVLRDPAGAGPDRLPTNREVATRVGWSLTKFNRKLDYLCVRLAKVGVRDLQGGRGAEAVNRRWRLVEHCIAARLITADDLSALG
jgi:hypothetical protein